MLVFLTLFVGALGLALYVWFDNFKYWKRLGFPYLEPTFPYGNLKDMILFRRYQGKVLQEAYNALAPHPYGGIYSLRRPMLLLRDPEIIKQIMVKDFLHFRDRLPVNGPFEQFLSEHLFNLAGEKWRVFRTKLSPTFTTGKIKMMYSLFEHCSNELNDTLKEQADKESMVDIKELMARFTTDVICNCAFGLEINSSKEPNNEFRQIGRDIFPQVFPTLSIFKLSLNSLLPWMDRVARFTAVPESSTRVLRKAVKQTVEYREKTNFKRNDFLDLLIELKKKGPLSLSTTEADGSTTTTRSYEMTMDVLTAQCFVFFVAGFETSSSVMTYCLYELALNPDIQERLRQEIDECIAKHSGLCYQAIQEMDYLEQVVSETIRKYPTLPILHRTCTADYRMPDTGLLVEEGTRVLIPTYALSHDPKLFPDPEKFDPDRFSPERKSSIVPYSFLPFGEGPRICIGMRFGQLQTKMGLCTILSNYRLYRSPNMKVPLEFNCTPFISLSGDPIILQIKHRDDK